MLKQTRDIDSGVISECWIGMPLVLGFGEVATPLFGVHISVDESGVTRGCEAICLTVLLYKCGFDSGDLAQLHIYFIALALQIVSYYF